MSRMPFSDSPTHFERSSGPFMEMKLHSLSLATAFASMVLPVPGGPKSRMPDGGRVPSRSKTSGYFSGHSTASVSSALISSRPPTSSQVTSGISTSTSRIAEGSTLLRAASKSSRVTRRVSRIASGISSSIRMPTMLLRRACIAASFTRSAMSAPTNP